METAIQAFERRAAALIADLGQATPAAEWKSPTDEELEILERLANDAGLSVEVIGSGKKRRCRIEVELEASCPAASSTSPPTATAGGATPNSGAGYSASSTAVSNSTLA